MSDTFVPAKSIFEYEDNVWIYQEQFNYLMHYDLKWKKVVLAVDLTKEVGPSTYCKILVVDGIVYLIPELGDCIVFYDLQSGELRRIDIPNCAQYNGQSLFCSAMILDNKLYCMPSNYECIVVIDLVNRVIDRLVDISSMLSKYMVLNYFGEAIIHNQSIVGVLPGTNRIYILDTRDFKIEVREIGDDNDKLTSLATVGEDIFLYSYSAYLIYNYSLKEERVCDEIRLHTNTRYRISSFGRNILVDSIHGEYVAIVDKKGNFIYERTADAYCNHSYRLDCLCSGIHDEKGKYYYNALENCLYEFCDDVFEKVGDLKVGDKQDLYLNNKVLDTFILKENCAVGLDTFVKTIVKSN